VATSLSTVIDRVQQIVLDTSDELPSRIEPLITDTLYEILRAYNWVWSKVSLDIDARTTPQYVLDAGFQTPLSMQLMDDGFYQVAINTPITFSTSSTMVTVPDTSILQLGMELTSTPVTPPIPPATPPIQFKVRTRIRQIVSSTEIRLTKLPLLTTTLTGLTFTTKPCLDTFQKTRLDTFDSVQSVWSDLTDEFYGFQNSYAIYPVGTDGRSGVQFYNRGRYRFVYQVFVDNVDNWPQDFEDLIVKGTSAKLLAEISAQDIQSAQVWQAQYEQIVQQLIQQYKVLDGLPDMAYGANIGGQK
jgi:hypothetical protein